VHARLAQEPARVRQREANVRDGVGRQERPAEVDVVLVPRAEDDAAVPGPAATRGWRVGEQRGLEGCD